MYINLTTKIYEKKIRQGKILIHSGNKDKKVIKIQNYKRNGKFSFNFSTKVSNEKEKKVKFRRNFIEQ